jgi:hypothetical protein
MKMTGYGNVMTAVPVIIDIIFMGANILKTKQLCTKARIF